MSLKIIICFFQICYLYHFTLTALGLNLHPQNAQLINRHYSKISQITAFPPVTIISALLKNSGTLALPDSRVKYPLFERNNRAVVCIVDVILDRVRF